MIIEDTGHTMHTQRNPKQKIQSFFLFLSSFDELKASVVRGIDRAVLDDGENRKEERRGKRQKMATWGGLHDEARNSAMIMLLLL
jgi:hypothetical protein